jgi:lysozyme
MIAAALLALSLSCTEGEAYTKANEGLRLTRYTDTTGHATIGYGHRCTVNDTRTTITMGDAEWIFANDYTKARDAAARVLDHLELNPETTPRAVWYVCVDIAFNCGQVGLASFVRFLAALKARDYYGAADELLDSRYARQVPKRAMRSALILRFAAREALQRN